VAVYSVAGSLVASSESNVVSVANLVKGIYVVAANTEAGVITGQIINRGFNKTIEELQKERARLIEELDKIDENGCMDTILR